MLFRSDTELVGNITADRPGVMYTSIPYDKGWRILVDGRPAAGRTIFDTFLAVDLDEGAHQISLTYEPEGRKQGAWISGISVTVLGLWTVGNYAMEKKKGCGKQAKGKQKGSGK